MRRTIVYEFVAGRQVHLLRSPDDITWVMQTYTNAKARDLTEEKRVVPGESSRRKRIRLGDLTMADAGREVDRLLKEQTDCRCLGKNAQR